MEDMTIQIWCRLWEKSCMGMAEGLIIVKDTIMVAIKAIIMVVMEDIKAMEATVITGQAKNNFSHYHKQCMDTVHNFIICM